MRSRVNSFGCARLAAPAPSSPDGDTKSDTPQHYAPLRPSPPPTPATPRQPTRPAPAGAGRRPLELPVPPLEPRRLPQQPPPATDPVRGAQHHPPDGRRRLAEHVAHPRRVGEQRVGRLGPRDRHVA